MRKKIFTFLLALAASVGMSLADTYVTITQNDFPEYGNSFTKDGVTVSAGYIDSNNGNILAGTGDGSFSTTLGNFTKIEVEAEDVNVTGEGWSGNHPKMTWTGNASSVSFGGEIWGMGNGVILKFTIGDPLPTYTVALKAGTANADKVTLSATSAIEGATVTVTPDEEYEITAFSAKYNTTEEAPATLDPATGAYSFTMPAFAVTIEATIALKPVPEGDIYAGFTATAGAGGFNNEGSANLVDNKFTSGNEGVNWTKWCANDGHKSVPTGESESCWWIDFEASEALNPTGYILTTGNDTGSEHGRNPKNWVLKAKLDANDAWTTIATVTNDVTMKNKSFKDYKFFVDQSGTYQYFRFEVFANQGADVMQLCELRLIGAEPVVLADCGLGWLNVPEGGVVGTIGHEDEIVLPQVNASLDFILAFQAHTATLRLGSTDESVLAVYGFNNFAVNGVGECDVYVVHDEDAVFAYDSAAFHVTVNPEPEPAGNVVIWNMSMDAVNGIVDQNETKEVFGGITIAVGAKRAFMKNGNVNALLFAFSSNTQEGFKGFTFANTLGVNFKKIVLSGAAGTFDGKESTGWVINDDQSTITWEGDAASVSIWETLNFIGPIIVNEVEFTLEGGDPTPTPAEDVNITPNVDPENPTVYYSTFYDSANKYALPACVEAYVADLSGANLLLTKIAEAGEVIPANVAVILKSTVTPFTLTPSDADAVTFTATNDLQGSDTQIATPANCYVLAGTDGVVGFYHYTAAMLNAHKAYVIYAPSQNQAPRHMPFVFNQATGVEDINAAVESIKRIENGQLIIIKNGVKYNAQGKIVK